MGHVLSVLRAKFYHSKEARRIQSGVSSFTCLLLLALLEERL